MRPVLEWETIRESLRAVLARVIRSRSWRAAYGAAA